MIDQALVSLSFPLFFVAWSILYFGWQIRVARTRGNAFNRYRAAREWATVSSLSFNLSYEMWLSLCASALIAAKALPKDFLTSFFFPLPDHYKFLVFLFIRIGPEEGKKEERSLCLWLPINEWIIIHHTVALRVHWLSAAT